LAGVHRESFLRFHERALIQQKQPDRTEAHLEAAFSTRFAPTISILNSGYGFSVER
jgi:hypothetical protein